MAEKAQRDFSNGFLNAGYLAASLRDNFPYERYEIYRTKPKWEPIFKSDASSISTIGDGVGKINQVVPNFFGNNNLRDLIDVESDDRWILYPLYYQPYKLILI